jgi:hypothetical protein
LEYEIMMDIDGQNGKNNPTTKSRVGVEEANPFFC